MRKLKVMICLLIAVVLSSSVQAQERSAEGYPDARLARVSFVDGRAFVERSYEEGSEEALQNLPLFESDSLTTDDSLVEIHLNRGNYLRVARDSALLFKRLPVTGTSVLTAFLERGSIYLDLRNVSDNTAFEVQSRDCGIFIQTAGIYRIDVGNETQVFNISGRLEIAGSEDSKFLRDGQMLAIRSGAFTSRVSYYAPLRGDFENFQNERVAALAGADYYSGHYLDDGFMDYEYELSRSGRWIYNYEFRRNVWIPYRVSSVWRPYYNGRWVWNPLYGYVWLSYDSWGWFTHYHGRWHWDPFYGWSWLPDYTWSGAWTNWFQYGDYMAWCPIDWWGRPIVIINNHWHRDYDWRGHGIPHNSRSTIIIRKDQMRAPVISKAAISSSVLGTSVRFTMLEGAPSHVAVSKGYVVTGKNGGSFIVKDGGLLSSNGVIRKVDIDPDSSNPVLGSGKNSTVTGKDNLTATGVIRRSGGETSVSAGGALFRSRSSQSSQDGSSSQETAADPKSGVIYRRSGSDSSGSSSGEAASSYKARIEKKEGSSDSSSFFGKIFKKSGSDSSSSGSSSVVRKSGSSSGSSSSNRAGSSGSVVRSSGSSSSSSAAGRSTTSSGSSGSSSSSSRGTVVKKDDGGHH